MAKENNTSMKTMACTKQEERLLLYAVSELGGAERTEFEAHVAECSQCATALEQERTLLAALASSAPAEETDAAFLAGCRAGLADALDHEEDRQWLRRWMNSLLGGNWPAWKPLATAAALLVMGFSAGFLSPRWAILGNGGASTPGKNPATNNPQISTMNNQDLQSMDIAGIRVTPRTDSAPPDILMTVNTQQPVTVEGTVNNDEVKRRLLFVLENGQRFQPDVRLDAVELLRPRLKDADVEQALSRLVETDKNPGVRLKALEALRGAAPTLAVQHTFLGALDDANPGVRIEAVNALTAMVNEGRGFDDPEARDVLRERMHRDPNNYVRVQSASLVRQMGTPQ
jgi:hypothetical protein